MAVFLVPLFADIKEKLTNLSRNRVLDRAAILAFYFLIAIFPLIYFFGVLIGAGGAPYRGFLGTVFQDLEQVLPRAASLLITDTLRKTINRQPSIALSFVLPLTWWSVCQGMLAIIDGINQTLGIIDSRPWWKRYFLASALTGFFVFLFAIAVVVLTLMSDRKTELLSQVADETSRIWCWMIYVWAAVFLFVLAAFNCVYRYSPNHATGRWQWLMPGTLLGTAFFLTTSMLLKSYLHNFATLQATYSSASPETALLLWLYLSGLAILVGAELNKGLLKAPQNFGIAAPAVCKASQVEIK